MCQIITNDSHCHYYDIPVITVMTHKDWTLGTSIISFCSNLFFTECNFSVVKSLWKQYYWWNCSIGPISTRDNVHVFLADGAHSYMVIYRIMIQQHIKYELLLVQLVYHEKTFSHDAFYLNYYKITKMPKVQQL